VIVCKVRVFSLSNAGFQNRKNGQKVVLTTAGCSLYNQTGKQHNNE
jgi:hypothetical protein